MIEGALQNYHNEFLAKTVRLTIHIYITGCNECLKYTVLLYNDDAGTETV